MVTLAVVERFIPGPGVADVYGFFENREHLKTVMRKIHGVPRPGRQLREHHVRPIEELMHTELFRAPADLRRLPKGTVGALVLVAYATKRPGLIRVFGPFTGRRHVEKVLRISPRIAKSQGMEFLPMKLTSPAALVRPDRPEPERQWRKK